jgi:hypothetical protein
MKAPALELGDIFRLHGPAYLTTFGDSLSHDQKKALRAIGACRTAALGGHVDQCDRCGYRKISYCSCRNRHCPKCRGRARARWLERRAAELLPVEYFHVVFTLPQLIAPLALQNQRLVYGILFRAAAETLLRIGADPRHLGARIGFLAVLHTWGQNLHHPSTPPLRRSRRRNPTRPQPLDFMSPAVSISGQSAQPSVPRQIHRIAEICFPPRRARFSRRAEVLGRQEKFRPMAKARCRNRVGSLCQATLWRTATSAEVPGALYPSGSDIKPAPGLAGKRASDFSLEELRPRKRVRHHDLAGGGVHSALSAACSAQRFCQGASLRVSGQPLPQPQRPLVPQTAGGALKRTAGVRFPTTRA